VEPYAGGGEVDQWRPYAGGGEVDQWRPYALVEARLRMCWVRMCYALQMCYGVPE
jgi:hypothetical protein